MDRSRIGDQSKLKQMDLNSQRTQRGPCHLAEWREVEIFVVVVTSLVQESQHSIGQSYKSFYGRNLRIFVIS
jgi:hypothetical protein